VCSGEPRTFEGRNIAGQTAGRLGGTTAGGFDVSLAKGQIAQQKRG
jgi:hypothetical protein